MVRMPLRERCLHSRDSLTPPRTEKRLPGGRLSPKAPWVLGTELVPTRPPQAHHPTRVTSRRWTTQALSGERPATILTVPVAPGDPHPTVLPWEWGRDGCQGR